MSNTYFRFKQFTVHQERCAMKVSTDACIFGAWTPVAEGVKNILDIGTGTGLLALMLAQRNADVCIDAIELDPDAAMQARQNIEQSPWRDRIQAIEGDVRNYPFSKKYDLIICNPPFFQNSLLGPDSARNNVRHNLSLSFEDLLNRLNALLSPKGYCSILLPVAEHGRWEQLIIANGYTVFNKLLICLSGESAVPNRIASLCALQPAVEVTHQTLYIYKDKGLYTNDFRHLLSPFYLNL